MAKGLTILADMRRDEHCESLAKLSDRDLCEMIRAHFDSHPTLPGEKEMKDTANRLLVEMNANQEMTDEQKAVATQKLLSEKQALPAGFQVSDVATPFDNDNLLTSEAKQDLIQAYAKTRIRETSLKEGIYYLDFRHFDPTALKRHEITEVADTAGNPIFVDRVNVELQKNGAGEVYVLAEQSDGSLRTIGTLPENFLKNNPMNVDSCSAEVQIADFSNGNMKNLSVKVVVDTDLMSGDVIELDEAMFAGLDQETGLEQ